MKVVSYRRGLVNDFPRHLIGVETSNGVHEISLQTWLYSRRKAIEKVKAAPYGESWSARKVEGRYCFDFIRLLK